MTKGADTMETVVVPIHVKLTAEDVAAFNRYHGRRQLALLFLFYWVLFVLVGLYNAGRQDALSVAAVVGGGLIFSGALLGLHLWTIQRRTRKMFDSDKNARLEQRIELTDEGVRHTIAGDTSMLAWADVHKAVEAGAAILLYVAANKAIVLPRRDVADWAQLRAILRRHLPAAKLRLK